MNIVRENRENQTALLKVTVLEADYAADVEKKLREYKRKANVPGFRPGMVPMGIVSKMYRKGTVAEAAYKMASDSCFNYLQEEKIEYMGDVLPSEEQGDFDFENNTTHEFIFEIGLAPEVNIALSQDDELTRYEIEISQEMRDGYRSNFLRRYGRLVDKDVVTKEEAITCKLDNGDIQVDEAYVGLISMPEEARAPFIGKKVGDEMTVNVNELYTNPAQRASILSVEESELEGINPEFKMTIDKIREYAEPEMDETFFKEAFPEGEVTDVAGFDAFIAGKIAEELEKESEYIFGGSLREYIVNKANLTLPETFLKRWLITINEGKFTAEDIEKDFAGFVEMMKWNTIMKFFVKEANVEVQQADLVEEAKGLAAAQFAQYGMMNVGDEMLENYANQMLSNKQEANKIVERLYERKVLDTIKPQIKITSKKVTTEELEKILTK